MNKIWEGIKFTLLAAILVVGVLALVEGGAVGDIQVMGTTHFTNIEAEDITATDDLAVTDDAAITGLATVGETLGVTGNTTLEGTLAVTGAATLSNDLTVDDTFNLDENASTLASTQTLTPTMTYYQMSPATTLTLTLATGSATEGDFLILQSIVATDTVIVDTTCTVGGGNITLGTAGDMALFIFGNSLWCEIASPDNS